MRPSDLTNAAESHPLVAAGLWATWLLISFPFARELVESPAAFLLRGLPIARWPFWIVQGLHLLLAEAPFAALWAVGEGPSAAVVATFGAAAVHSLLALRPRTVFEFAALTGLGAALVLPVPFPLKHVSALSAFAWFLPAAWCVAIERKRFRWKTHVWGPGAMALASAQLVTLWRRDFPTILRGSLAALVASAVALLASMNNGIDDVRTIRDIYLGASAPALFVITGWISRLVLRIDADDGWYLDALGVRLQLRSAAATAAVSFWGATWGLLVGMSSAVIQFNRLFLEVLVTMGLWGALLAPLAMACRRRFLSGDGREAGQSFAVIVAVVVPLELGVWRFGASTVVALGIVATLAIAFDGHKSAASKGRAVGIHEEQEEFG